MRRNVPACQHSTGSCDLPLQGVDSSIASRPLFSFRAVLAPSVFAVLALFTSKSKLVLKGRGQQRDMTASVPGQQRGRY